MKVFNFTITVNSMKISLDAWLKKYCYYSFYTQIVIIILLSIVRLAFYVATYIILLKILV